MWGGGSCVEDVMGVCGVPQAYICTMHIRTVHLHTYVRMVEIGWAVGGGWWVLQYTLTIMLNHTCLMFHVHL